MLVFKETENIGDDIQAYATERFLPQIDYFIDRESLNVFQSDNHERVAVIMNAWYMYHKYNWPPSPYIFPCFLSIHISNDDQYMIQGDFFNSYCISYFKEYAPIGTRDSSTLRLLQSHGINSFFSGCMTLTLEPDKNISREKIIYCVDVEDEIITKIKKQAPFCKVISTTHEIVKMDGDFCWNKKREDVKKLLLEYQKAHCVITTRLHCALPCLALGTPVLLLYNDEAYFKNRMEDYLPLLHYCSKSEFLEGDIYNVTAPPPNKTLHIEIKHKLVEEVHHFLEMVKYLESETIIPENYWYNQLVRQSQLLKKQLPKLKEKHDHAWEIEQAKNYYESQMGSKDLRINELESWIKELEKAKEYLVSQSGYKDSRIKELETWAENLQETRIYLEKQVEAKDFRIKELENWTCELENAKKYLENQVDWKDLRIKELERWVNELEKAKNYLENLIKEK